MRINYMSNGKKACDINDFKLNNVIYSYVINMKLDHIKILIRNDTSSIPNGKVWDKNKWVQSRFNKFLKIQDIFWVGLDMITPSIPDYI